MVKKVVSIFASTSRKHEKKSALNSLRAEIGQHTQTGVSSPQSTSGGAVAPTDPRIVTTNAVNLTLPEDRTYFSYDGIEIMDDQGVRWGEFINQIPIGDSSSKTDIQINTILSRIDSSNFSLPSRAQYIMDVWFDNLKAEPDIHYVVISETDILTATSLGSQMIVTAFYLNELETI